MRALIYRICLTCINILFPPLAVAMLCGLDFDCIINCLLFLCAVIPSHVHGFYISCTYFHRRHKVKRGQYPGGPKSFIHAQNVINGGATAAEVDRLWRKEKGMERKSSRREDSGGSMRRTGSSRLQRDESTMRRNDSYRPEMAQRQGNQLGRTGTNRSRMSDQSRRPGAHRTGTEEHLAKDGYGLPQRMASSRTQAAGYSPVSPQTSQSSRRFQGF